MTFPIAKNLFLGIILMGLCHNGQAQEPPNSESNQKKVYKVNYWVSGGITLTGVLTNSLAHERLRNKPVMTDDHVEKIAMTPVNGFDRWALRQDPNRKDDAAKFSDNLSKHRWDKVYSW